MQQYRVNYPLLIGLVVGSVLLSGLVAFAWKIQIERKAGSLIVEAQNAYEAGDIRNAVLHYGQYCSIQPRDTEARVKFTNAFADLAEQQGASPEERRRAIDVMEATLRDLPGEKALRRRLAEVYGKYNLIQDALDHLGFILDDPQAQALRAKFLTQSGRTDEAATYSYKLIGFDPDKGEFVEKGTSPNDPLVYVNLARILREKGQPELAERIVDQAVVANPDSTAAYLARGQYYLGIEELDRGKLDVAKARELSPEDADVLLTVAGIAINEKDYEKAREALDSAKKFHPQDPRVYQSYASLFMQQSDYKSALAQIDEGLKAVTGPTGQFMLIARAELQLQAADVAGVRETIQRMKDASFLSEWYEWYEARALVVEQKWFQANVIFNRLRPWASNFVDKSVQINFWLAVTYEQLGRYELARDAYELVLGRAQQDQQSLMGKQRMDLMLGREGEVAAGDPIQLAVDEELSKPAAAQNWDRVKEVVTTYADKLEWNDLTRQLAWANILAARKEFAAARKLLGELAQTAPTDLRVKRLMVKAVSQDQTSDMGPKVALKLFESTEGQIDHPLWRLDKADVLIAINDEQTLPELAGLLSGIEGWNNAQKVALWNGMADRYLRLRQIEDARRCLTLVAEHATDDLQARMRLFDLALDTNDDAGAAAAQKEILRLVGSESDANWLFAEARRRMRLIRRGQLDREAIADVRRLVERALVDRPEWHELHILNADIELFAGNARQALRHFDRVDRENLGRMAPLAMATYIQLLAAFGDIDRAAQKLTELPESVREQLLGPLELELLFRTNQVEQAISTARARAESNAEDAAAQFRYGQLLARSSEQPGVTAEQKKTILRQAIQALEKAAAIQPELGNVWYTLVLYNAMAGDDAKAHKALRDAQLALSGDELQFVLAKCYESLGQWLAAESMYRAFYEAKPGDVERAHQLAAFYLGPGYQQPDLRDKATPYINQILRAGADGSLAPSNASLLWARRMGARMLASSGDYQQLRKAENLLASNSQDGVLPLDDRLEMAQILYPRPEPESRIKAMQLLEAINEAGRLNEASALMLGRLYYARGDWLETQRHMRQAIVRFPESPAIHDAYVRMLLAQGGTRNFNEAREYLDALAKLSRDDPNTFELMVRLAIKTSTPEKVLPVVRSRVPKITDPKKQLADDKSVRMMTLFSSLLTELKDLDGAEKIYRQLVEGDPKRVFALAAFLGVHRDVQQCFDLLAAEYSNERVHDVLRVAVSVIRSRRSEIGDKFDANVEEWFERALRASPGEVALLLAKAEFLEVQQKFDAAIAIYSDLLRSPDVTGLRRAVLLNNLAYLIALSSPDARTPDVDALALVEEAVSIFGPTADILDTRAVVLTARKRYQEALADLELSLMDNPTAAKYFHQATAHLLAGQNGPAVASWEKAVELGLTPGELNQLEHPRYQEIKGKIEQLQAGSNAVTRVER